ncbi:MAG: Holliday junction branch migration DNA helicase RuvB [bacterium]
MDPLLSPKRLAEDENQEKTLRPQHAEEFVGQEPVMRKLRLYVEAARRRGEPLDHLLLFGPPGLGKTTLAYIVANEMGATVKTTSGPLIERKDDLAAILTDLQTGDVLFIDEIHRLNRLVEECLYPAMEDFRINILIGEGPHAKSIRLDLPRFTLVGATTRAGMITAPLRSRFGISERLQFYSEGEMLQIVKRSAGILRIETDEEGGREIARRSRGTPRIANRLLRRVRDYAQVKADGRIDHKVAQAALAMEDIDLLGLDLLSRQYLSSLIDKFGGGPVGLNTLAVSLMEDEETLEDMLEPFLIQIGFLNRTPRGRVATPHAYEHLKKKYPGPTQEEML